MFVVGCLVRIWNRPASAGCPGHLPELCQSGTLVVPTWRKFVAAEGSQARLNLRV